MSGWWEASWEAMGTEKLNSEKREMSRSEGFLYQFAVAFPSWAGAIVALYAILLSGLGLWKLDAIRRLR